MVNIRLRSQNSASRQFCGGWHVWSSVILGLCTVFFFVLGLYIGLRLFVLSKEPEMGRWKCGPEYAGLENAGRGKLTNVEERVRFAFETGKKTMWTGAEWADTPITTMDNGCPFWTAMSAGIRLCLALSFYFQNCCRFGIFDEIIHKILESCMRKDYVALFTEMQIFFTVTYS